MARPAVVIFIFLAGGIVFGRFLGLQWLLAFAAFACALAALYYFAYKRLLAVVLPIFAVLGAVMVCDNITSQSEFLEEAAQREAFVRAEGWVEDISLTRTGRQRVRVSSLAFSVAPLHEPYEANMAIMAYLPEGLYVQLGQRVLVSGYLQLLEPPRNPGGFNQFQFLRSRGIEYRLFAESAESFEVVMTPAMHIRSFGLRLSDVFHEVLPMQMAGIVAAMVVGDRSGLDADTRSLYSSVGMFHILVVSGLHVNILALAFAATLGKLGMKSVRNRGLVTIAFIVIFTILTGAGVATVRAALMGIMLVVTGMLGYAKDTPTSLAIAAVAILLWQPLFLFDLGFIYSFSMVLALVVLTPALTKAMDMLALRHAWMTGFANNWFIKKYFAFNLAAVLVYMLVNSFIFFEFSPYSLLANLIIMPSVAATLVFGLLTALVGLISTFAAQVLAFPVWLLLSFYEIVMEGILRLPYAVMLTGRPQTVTLAVLGASLVAFVLIINNGKQVAKRLGIMAATAAVALVSIAVANAASPVINTTFLYVGQGNAMVMHRGREAVLIDGGGVFGRELGENAGVFALAPYLNYRGIRSATAIVTHNHRDHSMGIVELMQMGRIEHLIMAKANSQATYYMYDLLIYHAHAAAVPITYVSAGDVFEFGDMRLYVLFPYEERIFGSENDNSIVIRAVHGDGSMLLTGDIEIFAENYLSFRGQSPNAGDSPLASDLLQVAHHGSRTSTTEAFLQSVNPQAAVISAGRNNMFNHPHPSVTNRLYEHNITYFVTARQGAILVRTDGRRMTVTTMLGE